MAAACFLTRSHGRGPNPPSPAAAVSIPPTSSFGQGWLKGPWSRGPDPVRCGFLGGRTPAPPRAMRQQELVGRLGSSPAALTSRLQPTATSLDGTVADLRAARRPSGDPRGHPHRSRRHVQGLWLGHVLGVCRATQAQRGHLQRVTPLGEEPGHQRPVRPRGSRRPPADGGLRELPLGREHRLSRRV